MPNPRNNDPPDWDGRTERRSTTPNSHVTHGDLDQRLSEGRLFTSRHIDGKFNELKELIESGFPQGDPKKHRELHELLLQEASDRRDLWKSIREKTVAGIVYSCLVFVGLAIWEAIKAGVIK